MTQPAFRPLTVGEILDQSFGLYRRYLPILVVITVICTIVPQLGLAYLGVTVEPTQILSSLGEYAVLLIAAAVLSALAIAASTLVLSEGYLGRSLATGDAIKKALTSLGSIVAISLGTTLVIMLGLILFIVPGVILATGLAVATQVLMIEPGTNASSAMSRSWTLTKGFRLRILGILLITALIILVIAIGGAMVIGALAGAAGLLKRTTAEQQSYGFNIAVQAGNIIVKTVLMPLITCVLTVTYFDLRVRAEGFDLEALAGSITGQG